MTITQPTYEMAEMLTILRQNMPHLSSDFNVQSLGVFGSYVHGSAGLDSDLDVLVEFSDTPTLFQFVRLQRALSEMVGAEVDLVMKSGLKPVLGKQILAEVVPV